LNALVNPSDGGTVIPSSGVYNEGTQVSLRANAASGYEFSHWSGDASGTSSTTTLVMNSNKGVTANFKKKVVTQVITRTISPGSISTSTTEYNKYLQAGEQVTGTVQLTGTHHATDWSYKWQFEIIDPKGTHVDSWEGHWLNNPRHTFGFTASQTGMYRLRITHWSSYNKNLRIEIKPSGWSP